MIVYVCTISKFAFTYFEFIWYFDLVIICELEKSNKNMCGLKAFTTIIVLEIRIVTYLTVVFSANIMYK